MLRRLAYPNRLVDIINLFHRDKGTISRIHNFMLKYLYNKHASRLHSLSQPYLSPLTLQQLADVSKIQVTKPIRNIFLGLRKSEDSRKNDVR